jgi:hypothetical protein
LSVKVSKCQEVRAAPIQVLPTLWQAGTITL